MRVVTRRSLLAPVALQSARNLVAGGGGARRQLRRDLWLTAKRFAASRTIREVELAQLEGVGDTVVHGYVDDVDRLVIAAICARLQCRTVFEIGTYLGRTAYTVALTNPDVNVYTLDLPDAAAAETVTLELTDPQLFERWERGRDFLDTPEAARIHRLFGDSAEFDFSPFLGTIDLVYIDGSHSYTYVKSDSENALDLIGPEGTIVWDDYPHYPGVHAYLNELASSLDGPLLHIAGTRLVLFSRHPLLAGAGSA